MRFVEIKKHVHQITPSGSANCTLAFVRRNLNSCLRNIKTTASSSLTRKLVEYSSLYGNHTAKSSRVARFCYPDYTSRETVCVSKIKKNLHWEQLTTKRNKHMSNHILQTHQRSFILVSLLQPTQRQSRYLHSKALNIQPRTTLEEQ